MATLATFNGLRISDASQHQESKIEHQKNLLDLPLEIIMSIADYLKGEDLRHLEQLSPKMKAAALSTKNMQEMKSALKELEALRSHSFSKSMMISSTLDVFTGFFSSILERYYIEAYPGAAVLPSKLQQLKNHLRALATNQVAQQLLDLKHAIFQDINQGLATYTEVEDQYLHFKCALFSSALEHIISCTIDPLTTRGLAVRHAAHAGHFALVAALLASGDISEEHRGVAVCNAAEKGHLMIVNFLVARGDISEEHRGVAACNAAEKGHLKIVLLLLKDNTILDLYRNISYKLALQHGYRDIAHALEKSGPVTNIFQGKCFESNSGYWI